MTGARRDIYDPAFVERLFDEMSPSYEWVNYVSSFGFSLRWRLQLARAAGLREGDVVADLMTGMGECWPALLRRIGPRGRLVAVDFSAGMLAHAHRRRRRFPQHDVEVRKENALQTSIPDSSVDAVVSGFGLKTLAPDQWRLLARETRRILRPGGRFGVVDVSVPPYRPLRAAYMLYLQRFIPRLGRLFLGNPENYRMLGVYTERFGDARRVAEAFRGEGLLARYAEYFHGCATGVVGEKPTA